MKVFLSIVLSAGALTFSPAFGAEEIRDAVESAELVARDAKRSSAELDKLVAPIALYPDSLIALMLPASTASADIVLAARFLSANGDTALIDAQSWEESIKGLARYPAVLNWMDENLEWTRTLGEAFAVQPADVMTAIQRLREQAKAGGFLADTPEQKIVVEERYISILPSRADVIYVPCYDPGIFWWSRPYHSSFITFSAGFAVGAWLHYDCDWRHRTVWVHRRTPGWAYRHDHRWHDHDRDHRHHFHPSNGSVWVPDARRHRAHAQSHRTGRSIPSTTRNEFALNSSHRRGVENNHRRSDARDGAGYTDRPGSRSRSDGGGETSRRSAPPASPIAAPDGANPGFVGPLPAERPRLGRRSPRGDNETTSPAPDVSTAPVASPGQGRPNYGGSVGPRVPRTSRNGDGSGAAPRAGVSAAPATSPAPAATTESSPPATTGPVPVTAPAEAPVSRNDRWGPSPRASDDSSASRSRDHRRENPSTQSSTPSGESGGRRGGSRDAERSAPRESTTSSGRVMR